MAMEHYTIDNDKKKIFAIMELANDKDLKLIKKYLAVGYELVPVERKKRTIKTKEEKEAERLEKQAKRELNKFSEMNIRKYLDEKGTAKQRKEYERLYNEQAKDKNGNPVFYKTNSKDGRFKVGEPKRRGHIATLTWFKKEFPNYPD